MKIFIKVLFAYILLQPFYAFSESEGLKILVVGAGISGLGVARDLHDSGYKVTVLEARKKIGGRIDTDRSLGFPIERGANWIHSNELENNRLMSIKEELGLKTYISLLTAYDGVKLFDKNGNVINLKKEDLEKIEFRIGLAAYIASYIKPSSNLEDVIDFLKRISLLSLAPNAVLQAIHQTLELSAAEDSKNMPIGVLIEEAENAESAGSDEEVIGGFDQITNHLSQNLDIKLNTPVTKIDYSSKKIKVFTDKQAYVADSVVVTVPLGVLQQNLIEFVPELPEKKRDAISNINLGNVNKVILRFPYKFWGDDKMFFIERENRSAFSTWFNNEVIVNEPVIYSIISGDYSRELEKKSDEYVIEEAMKPLRVVYGEDIPNPDSFLITRWGLEPYILGSYSTAGYNQDDLTLRTELANSIENKIFFAGEATSVNEYGFTHSALNTGLREAKKIKELYPLDLQSYPITVLNNSVTVE